MLCAGASVAQSTQLAGRVQSFAKAHDVYASLGGQQAVAIGDFDRDGRVDVCGVQRSRGELHVGFLEQDDSYTLRRISSRKLDWVGDLAAADFDGDGDLDIAVPSDGYEPDSAGELRIFINPGSTARTADWQDVLVFRFANANHINDIRVVDLDRDGKLDIVARSRATTNRIILAFQGATLAQWTTQLFTTSYSNVRPEGLHVADLDGDGTAEILGDGWLLVATSTSKPWRDGAARTVLWSEKARWFQKAVKLDAADIDRDGRMDIVVVKAEGGDGDLSWLSCAGDPRQSTPKDWTEHVVKQNVGQMHHVECHDFDGDGDSDILVGGFRPQDDGLRIYYQARDPGTWLEQRVAAQGCYHGGVVDRDRDGDPDILAIDGYRGRLFAFENITPSGAANSPDASLYVAKSGRVARSGPFPVAARSSDTLDLEWRAAVAPIGVLAIAPKLALGSARFPCGEALDLDLATPPYLSLAVTLDAAGRAATQVQIPAQISSGRAALQAIFLDTAAQTCALRVSSAYELAW